jgi:hypothetical protein
MSSRMGTGCRAVRLTEVKGLLETHNVDPEQGEFLFRLLREGPDQG